MGLTQSHSEQKSKKKKKRKKKKKHKKKKEKKKAVVAAVFVEEHTKQNEDKMEVETEAHDIDVTVHNGGNMGFDDAELNEEHIVLESSKDIELTKDEVTATMNDLEMELMKHNETTDAFDLSDNNSSNSTQENEYREDSESET